jgi:hypothetical protein
MVRSAHAGGHKHKFVLGAGCFLALCVLYLLSAESQWVSNPHHLWRSSTRTTAATDTSTPSTPERKSSDVSYILEVLKWNITRDESGDATLPSFAAGTCFRLDEEGVSQRCLPSFIIIGTQKSGTSELSSWLQANPGLLRMRQSESHFFDCLRKCGSDRLVE